MPTENPRPEKVAVVDEVREKLQSSSAAILTEYRGLTVGEISTLRRSLRDAGGEYRIYKNTLVRFAVRELGLPGLEESLVGPTAIAFVDGDAVGVAKTLRDYARTNPNLVVKGGVLGENVLTAADAAALADIPPREVLLARLAGLIAAPMQQFAGLMQALPRNLAYGLKALIDQGGGAEAGAGGAVADGAVEAVADTPSDGGETPEAEPTTVGEEAADAAAAESAGAAEPDAPTPETQDEPTTDSQE